MSFIPTPYVFIAFDKRAIDDLFNGSKGLQTEDLITEYSGPTKDYLLFSGTSNPNFISLEHSLNAGSDAFSIKIQLIDPEGIFEERLIGASFYPQSFAHHLHPAKSRPGDKFTYNVKGNPFIQNPGNTAITKNIYDNKTQTERVDYYTKEFVARNKRIYYVAYGVGTNLNTWAGPFACEAIKIDVDVAEFKKITLNLTPLPNELSLQGKTFSTGGDYVFNYYGATRLIKGSSKKFSFNEFSTADSPEVYKSTLKNTNFTNDIKVDTNFSITDEEKKLLQKINNAVTQVDIHNVICDCIKSYIRQATGRDNVLVVLPNLNYLLLNNTFLQYLTKNYKLGSSINPKKQKALNLFYGLGTFLKSFNIDLALYKWGTSPTYQDFRDYKTPGTTLTNWLEYQDKPSYIFDGSGYDVYATLNHYVKENEPVDYYRTLNELITKINEYQVTLPIIPCLFYETNPKITKIWEEYISKNELPFSDGTNHESAKGNIDPWIIFGDQYLINKLVYGGAEYPKNTDRLKNVTVFVQANQNAFTPEQKNKIAQDIIEINKKISFLQKRDVEIDKILDSSSGPILLESEKEKLKEEKEINASDIEELKQQRNQKALISPPKDKVQAPASAPRTHPIDSLFFQKEYNDKVRSVVFPDNLSLTYADTKFNPNNEFEYNLATQFSSTPDIFKGVPVLRFNVKNPNVTKVKIDINTLYTTELNTTFVRELIKVAASHLAGKHNSTNQLNPFLNQSVLAEYIRARITTNKTPQEELVKELAENFTLNGLPPDMAQKSFLNPKEAEEEAKRIVENYRNQPPDKTKQVLINSITEKSPAQYMVDFSNQIHNKILVIGVETLPLFYLSNNSVIQSDCLLISKSPEFVLTQDSIKNNIITERQKFLTLTTGFYKIIGFKHTISADKMTSEFSLAKAAIQEEKIIDSTNADKIIDEAKSDPNSKPSFIYNGPLGF